MHVLLIGNLCKDVVYEVLEYPPEDAKVKAINKMIRIGGNAGNIAVSLSHYSDMDVHCCAKIGDCFYSKNLIDEMQNKYQTRLFPVIETNHEIPESVIIHSSITGSRTCLHYRGSCADLTVKDVVETIPNFSVYSWIHLEHRRNGSEVLNLAKFLKQKCPRTVISIDIEKVRDGFEEMLNVIDVAIVSKEVCKELGYPNLKAALSGLRSMVKNILVITWGDCGAAAFVNKDNESIFCDAFKVDNIIDSIGAGDSFSAAFIYAMLKSNSIQKSLQFGCQVASIKLQCSGMLMFNKHSELLSAIKSLIDF